ncbi:MAG: hypothetical protein QM770_14650 [Tepidisphaeraceae bacterium]
MSDFPHPQLRELEKKIAYFLENPQFEECIVIEPDSQSMVRFHIPLKSKRGFRSVKLGRVMEVELTPAEAERADVLLKIGFEESGRRKGNFEGERNCVFPRFTKPTSDARQAAHDVVRVMEEAFGLGESPWLWTFHLNDPDQWPSPLPKPDPWPPAREPG